MFLRNLTQNQLITIDYYDLNVDHR